MAKEKKQEKERADATDPFARYIKDICSERGTRYVHALLWFVIALLSLVMIALFYLLSVAINERIEARAREELRVAEKEVVVTAPPLPKIFEIP